jgi:hypothetical protein
MIIANPIYDIVFKYAMEDPEIAKDLLSLLLKLDIIKVEMSPQEITTETRKGIRIFRLDFKATIRTKTGETLTVLIEIQKSKKGSKVIRFRRYLGITYRTEEEIILDNGAIEKACLPITTVYFLGYRLQNIRIPVAKVGREYRNAITNRPLKITKKLADKTKIKVNAKEDFVEQLSHDMYVIQIPRLKMVVQTELEKVLDVFSQTKYQTNDKHFLEYTGDTSDPRVARLVKRLQRGTLDFDLLHAMDVEDEIESMIEDNDKELAEERKGRAEERKGREEERKGREDEQKAKIEALSKIEQLEQQLAKFEQQLAALLAQNASKNAQDLDS